MRVLNLCQSVLIALMLIGAGTTSALALPFDSIVVANRSGGTISIINTETDAVTTIPLPVGAAQPEPMYVFVDPVRHHVFVGDRANDRVVVYNASDFQFVTEIAAGDGIFHMWGKPENGQLWVTNDTAQSISVIDLDTLLPITSFGTPADLSAFKPHDVVLDPNADAAFVSMIDVMGNLNPDWVIRYDTTTFLETHRTQTGDDPHLKISATDNKLYVPAQNGNAVEVFSRTDLSPLPPVIDLEAAHGAAIALDGLTLYVTNIANGGMDGLATIDPVSQMLLDLVDTPFEVPHNIALSPDQNKLYLTHSGATQTAVSVWDISAPDRLPVLLTTVDTDLNPFGLASLAAIPEPGMLVLFGLGLAVLVTARRGKSASPCSLC